METKKCQQCSGLVERKKGQDNAHWALVKYCLKCSKTRRREQKRKGYYKDREKIISRSRLWIQAHPGYRRVYYQKNKEKLRETGRKSYQAHREKRILAHLNYQRKYADKLNEYRRRYYQENKERLKEYYRQYYHQNLEKMRAYQLKRYYENRQKAKEAKN